MRLVVLMAVTRNISLPRCDTVQSARLHQHFGLTCTLPARFAHLALEMEAAGPSESLLTVYRITWRRIPEDINFQDDFCLGCPDPSQSDC
jgi:hypothetical protein